VLLAAFDRDAEGGPDDLRLEPRALAEQTPPAFLVDERLSDVEEDRAQRHRQSLQCLAL